MGIKEASGDLKQCERIINSKSDNFLLLSGNDSETLAILKLGGNGSISVLANYKPEIFGNMVRSYLNKEYEKALKYQNELREYFEWMDLEGNPTSIKTALKTIHLCKKTVRSPLMEGSIDLENKFLTKKYY